MKQCPNCHFELTGHFCSNCGQKNLDGPLKLKSVLTDFLHAVFLFDISLYKTMLSVLFRPGKTAISYLSGKRKSSYEPLQFFIVFMTLYLIVLGLFGDDFFAYINQGLDIAQSQTNRVVQIQSLVRKNLNILYFLLTPILAFFTKRLFKDNPYNFAEHLIFAFYLVGVGFFLSMISVILGQFYPVFYAIKPAINFIYFPFALLQFSQKRSFWNGLKSILTIILSYASFMICIVILMFIYVTLST